MKTYRLLLSPFTSLYSALVFLRNKSYDWGWQRTTSFSTPTLVVGNLRVGGTGKTPHTEHLLRLLKDRGTTALLSRGYGRKTKGFRIASRGDGVADLGDEPLQIHRKFPAVTVAVDEKRVRGMQLLEQRVKPDWVVLDDAFQHRSLKPGFSLLLTSFSQPYFSDFLLPAGRLREGRCAARRADCILVTRAPQNLSERQKKAYRKALKSAPHQSVFFSTVVYSKQVCGTETRPLQSLPKAITVVTGIAHSKPLLTHIRQSGFHCQHLAFPDHHNFSEHDRKAIRIKSGDKPILTTEKDYMRLQGQMENLYYLPIHTRILDEEKAFEQKILNYVRNDKRNR